MQNTEQFSERIEQIIVVENDSSQRQHQNNKHANTSGNSIEQALWIQLDNQKISIKLGVIYAPKENVTPVRELKKIYESITKKIQEVREHKQQVIVLGDFNVKVGTTIQGSKETITKGGRLLLKMIQKEIMSLVNVDKHRCNWLWTREQGKEKSVIDYVMTNTEYLNRIKEI